MKRRAAARRSDPDPPPADAAPPSPPGMWPVWSDWIRPVEPFLIPLVLLLAARGLLWLMLPAATEDAYITFRYARNFAVGSGLIYNPGERVMGFTSPLWTLWCAVGWNLSASPVDWARLWGVLGDAVTLVVSAVMLRRHAGRAAAWCFAWFFAGWPYFSMVAISGMETSAMLTLVVLAAAFVERRSVLGGPALAALALMRPEGIAAAAVIALGARWRDRAVALALAGLGVAALWIYYGSPIPQSMLAKATIYGHPGPLPGRYWWDWLIPFPIDGPPKMTEGVHLFVLSVLVAPAIVMGLPVLWRARRTALGLAAGAGLVVWLGYALLGVAYFFWYLAVPLAGLLLVATAGVPRVVRGPPIYLSAALLVIGMWGVAGPFYMARAKFELHSFGRAADYLAAHARPGEKIFLEPIGLIGYRNPLVVVDEVGLVSPAVTRRRAQGPGWYSDVVAEQRPDWLVVRRPMLSGGATFAGRWAPLRDAAELDSLTARYPVATTIAPESGDRALLVLRRR
ncbi:MAG: hypothetical protein ACRENJ_01100 [Candidatus Eiseniibacteriota bacterium]